MLIFAQMRAMLDLVETELFAKEMTGVSYLRLDGTTPPAKRFSVQHKFNGDPTVDVLLLTTSVGGLGLTLTGADTVVFLEHDWNPMKDLQAMDRAHRIGQKKTVNVYRLIAQGSLEERIMGMQRFKLSVANSVVTQDNAALQSMDTSSLLDGFASEKAKAPRPAPSVPSSGGSSGGKARARDRDVIADAGLTHGEGGEDDEDAIADETGEQYDAEYQMDAFLASVSPLAPPVTE